MKRKAAERKAMLTAAGKRKLACELEARADAICGIIGSLDRERMRLYAKVAVLRRESDP